MKFEIEGDVLMASLAICAVALVVNSLIWSVTIYNLYVIFKGH